MAIGETFAATTKLTTITCGNCGGIYAIAEKFRKQKEEQEGGWICPYCKCNWGYWGENTTIGRLKREKEDLEQRFKWIRDETARERASHDQTKAALRAQKGVATKRKKQLARVQKGVCPHCNRFFENLHRHMETQHIANKD